jgi:uncharacterized protein YeeX (DUF496 family)
MKQTTMASFSVLQDATKPFDFGKWPPRDNRDKAMKQGKTDAAKIITSMDTERSNEVPAAEDMELDTAIQESMPWKEVSYKKQDAKTAPNSDDDSKAMGIENLENNDTNMKKVKITFAIRVPKDTTGFSPAKIHVDVLHEMHKFDESIIVFNHDGDQTINIEASMTEDKYKDMFRPVEKRIGREIGWISISHEVCMTRKAAECKETIFPILKKNKVFMYVNPKPGLEHFTAIGVLFGPNPDYTWRDELADLLIETMKPVVTEEEKAILGTTGNNEPKLILSLNVQMIGSTSTKPTKSVALEIRVPNEKQKIYIDILERLYEKSQDGEAIIPNKLGKFFPYYMKSKMSEVFNFLMRQQNADMADTTVIPIFGYTPEAQKQKIYIDNEETTVELAMATTKNILRIEATPSTRNLHKYLVIVKNDTKDTVMTEIQKIFRQIQGPLENQPVNFPVPRCGGSEKKPLYIPKVSDTEKNDKEKIDKTTTAYMISLETLALANNPQDAGPDSPPKRHRKFTISYASAAKAGILKKFDAQGTQSDEKNPAGTTTPDTATQDTNSTTNRQVSWDETIEANQSTGSSLSRSLTNSKMQSMQKDLDSELKALKSNLENRMNKQEQQMNEIVQVIKTMNDDFEKRMIHVVLAALSKEKEKVQELTHGRVYPASEAPLADEEGNLPYGGKVQLGGPLDRLHHVEVTVQQMSNALDAILEHMQKDPTAKYLFQDDDSETSTVIANNSPQNQNTNSVNSNEENEDVQMQVREYSGSKRHLSENSPLKARHGPDPSTQSSPQRSPPPKKERSQPIQPSADPVVHDRERGQS